MDPVGSTSHSILVARMSAGMSKDYLSYWSAMLKEYSLCPMSNRLPIEAQGIIPVSQSDVAGIPSKHLRIFAQNYAADI